MSTPATPQPLKKFGPHKQRGRPRKNAPVQDRPNKPGPHPPALQQPTRPPGPPPPQPSFAWSCCVCERVNPGMRTDTSICRIPECMHVSWINGIADGQTFSRNCGYCADHVIVKAEDENEGECFIVGSTQEGGWFHDDEECFRYHSTRLRREECERCGVKDIQREKCVLTRRLDWEQREPRFMG